MASTSKLTDDQRQGIRNLEARLGRKLTVREFLAYGTPNEHMERVDVRSEPERFKAGAWKPKMAEAKVEVTLDSAVAALEVDEKRAKLQRSQTGRDTLTRIDAQAKKEAKAAHDAQLAKNQPLVDKLVALKEKTKWDATWGAVDVESLERAIKQLSTEGACEKTGIEMAAAVFTLERQKKVEAHDTVAAKAQELALQRIALEAEINALEASAGGEGGGS